MRTLQQVRDALQAENVQLVSALSGVNPKTIYRMRQLPDYMPGADKVERVSRALDQLSRKRKTAAD
jgi:Holliday junction resolvasome RuvABC DNA-binding subunit